MVKSQLRYFLTQIKWPWTLFCIVVFETIIPQLHSSVYYVSAAVWPSFAPRNCMIRSLILPAWLWKCFSVTQTSWFFFIQNTYILSAVQWFVKFFFSKLLATINPSFTNKHFHIIMRTHAVFTLLSLLQSKQNIFPGASLDNLARVQFGVWSSFFVFFIAILSGFISHQVCFGILIDVQNILWASSRCPALSKLFWFLSDTELLRD